MVERENIEVEFVGRVTTLYPDQIVKVIFFGSRAKGIPKPGSDYDFLIVLNEKDGKIVEEIYDVVTDFLIKFGVDISLKIYKRSDFEKMKSYPTPFMASVLKTGRELWSAKT